MLAIRMRRLGAKKRPFFRVVVIDSHAARDGRALEVLGHYNPTTVPETFNMDHQRLEHWITRGAQPSDTVRSLLTRHPAGEAESEAAPATPIPTPAAPEARVTQAPVPEAAAVPATEAAETTEAPPTEESKES